MRTLAILLVLTLAACIPGPREQRANDEANCAGYGYARGTDGYAGCLLKLDVARRRMMVEILSGD